jgi:molecular chaperone HtpG
MLQNNPQVGQIRRAVTTRVLNEFESLAEKDKETFKKIWETFGSVIKEGIYEDFERRDQLLKLARFHTSSAPQDAWRSLKEYVEAMRPGQTEIYYLAGDSLERLKASPQLEAATARGVEVLLLSDPVDSFWTTMTPMFDGKPLRSLTQGEVDLSAIPLAGDAKPEEPASDLSGLVAALKTALGNAVSDVRASKRLVASAACLVAPGAGPDLALDRLLQRRNEGAGVRPILEINPAHALVKAASAAADGGKTQEVADLGQLLFDQARILDGELPSDPAKFAELVNRMVVKGVQASASSG